MGRTTDTRRNATTWNLLTLVVIGAWAATMQGGAARADESTTSQKLADYRRVVVADDALPVAQLAAEELAHYAGRIVGQPIEVRPLSEYDAQAEGLSFFVGQGAAESVLNTTLGPWEMEQYMLQTVPGGMVLAGDDREGDPWALRVAAGSLLAVYTLLDDHLGCKWFWAGPTGEHVPSNPDAVVPELAVRQTPRFIIRCTQLYYTKYLNSTYKEDLRKFKRRTRQAWVPKASFGHSWYYAFDLKQKENNPYFTQHPDWFALVNGERQPPQVCTTNPEVIEHMVEFVLNNPWDADICTISPSDGGGFCQCDEQTKSELHKRLGIPSCTALDVPGYMSNLEGQVSLSDRMFTYANEVARRVRERNPQRGVGMFAYAYYSKPPKNIDKLEPNLYLARAFQVASLRDPVHREQFIESIREWKKLGAKLFLREAWGMHYYFDLPFMHYRQIIDGIAECEDLGFVAVFGEYSKSSATQAPNLWAVQRMIWDPDRDKDAVMQEFYQTAYGPVADDMRLYWETYQQALDDNWSKRRFILNARGIAYLNVLNSWHLLLPPEVVEQAEQHLRAAEAKVPPGSEYADRVAFHRIGQDYTRVMLELLDSYRQLAELGFELEKFSEAVDQPRDDPDARQALLERAYELGELREDMLLAHRDLDALNEGLYAHYNDRGQHQWHAAVKQALGIDKPTRLTGATLIEGQ